jgi:hypothetical protein
MKCHAGVKFPDGKPCPKCGAKLGEVCWPGINADLLELARLRAALRSIASKCPATCDMTLAHEMAQEAEEALVPPAHRADPDN